MDDLEIWLPAIGYEGRYEVSNHGRIMALFEGNHGELKPGRILNPTPKKNKGYLYVGLYDTNNICRHRSVHSLILESFVGPRPKGAVSRHLNGIKTDNGRGNLKWGTPKQNVEDSIKHGVFPMGEKCRTAKLVPSLVLEVRAMYDKGVPHKVIAAQFGIAQPTVSQIGCRKSWKHIPEA